MLKRDLRHVGARLQALHHDADLVVARPAPPTAGTRNYLNPANAPGPGITLGQPSFKLMLKLMVKTIAHGPALRHSPQPAEMWEPDTAYAHSAVFVNLDDLASDA